MRLHPNTLKQTLSLTCQSTLPGRLAQRIQGSGSGRPNVVTQGPLQQQQPHRARHVDESSAWNALPNCPSDLTDQKKLLSFCCFLFYLILPSLAPASSSSSSSSQSGPCTPVLLRQALMQLLPGRIQLAVQCLHILFCQCVRPPVCVCV